MAATAWLAASGKNWIIALVPGMFMTFIVTSFILWTSPEHGGPAGFGMNLYAAYVAAAVLTVLTACFAWRQGRRAAEGIRIS